MKTKNAIILGAVVAVLFAAGIWFQPKQHTASAEECGAVTVAEMNWSSATFLGHLDKYILETAFGCDVTMVSGATVGIATSLAEKSEPDIASEIWASTIQEIVDESLERGVAVIANPEPITGGASENWYVLPKTLEAHPELKTVQDVIDNPEIFGGKIYICPVGWGCHTTTRNIMEAYGAEEKGWELIEPGSGIGLDASIAKAGVSDEHWFGFYWEPAGMVAKFDMQPVPTGTGFAGDDHWANCITNEECDTPKITEFSKPTLYSLASSRISQNSAIMQYLQARAIDINLFNSLIIKMDEQQETAEESVETFLKSYPEVWTGWFNENTVKTIKSSLN